MTQNVASERRDNRVPGYCPMGCGQTLFTGSGGYVTCSWIRCPRPTAVSDLLEDNESHHIVELRETEFTVRHPLRERLDDALMTCQLHADVASLPGPPHKPGRYRVFVLPGDDAGYSWKELPT